MITTENGTSDGYSFSDENYNTGKCGSGHNLAGDIPQGNATYDAATANMGARWKMFTRDQGQELIDNTTSQWITLNGVSGRKFVNKSNSTKYIFLPSCGHWYYGTHFDISYARYWSTTIDTSSYSDSLYIEFTSSFVHISPSARRDAFSIRPIKHIN